MRNIALIIQKLNGGGAERAIANLSKDLCKNYNVYIIVFDGKNIAYPYSGELIDLNIPASKNVFSRIINSLKRIYKVKKIKKELNINTSISFMPGANIVNLFSKSKDIIITSERNMMSIVSKNKLDRFIIKFIAKYSDKTISLSEGVKKDLIDNFNINPNKIVTIYNSCNYRVLNKHSEEVDSIIKGLDSDKRYIVNIGRLHKQKGQWHLIKAFKKVNDTMPESRLIILGEGELLDNLKELSKKLGIEDKIYFLGYIKDYHKILEMCEIFVFTSLVEGLGNVLLESLSFGLPVISTDCYSGPREILAPNTDIDVEINTSEMAEYGILVPRFKDKDIDLNNLDISEEEILAGQIIEVLNNPELRKYYFNKAKLRINDFSSESIAKKWIEVIENLNKR